MKKLFISIILISLSQHLFPQSGVRFSEYEFFTVSTSIDPNASIKTKGLDFVGEIEYSGIVYVKAGFETFSVMYGGYQDVHVAVGFSLSAGYYEQFRIYSGFRMANVWRGGEGAFRQIYGLESGIEYNVTNSFFVGVRATLDKRYDQEIFGWKPELKASGFIRLGYKWYFKNRQP